MTAAGAPLRVRHAANSSGALLFPEARLDLVRTGIAIYGHGRWPAGSAPHRPSPQAAMRLVTEVAQLRTIAVGASVGYGATWRAERASRVAILPLGYADGLPRRATGRAQAAIRGHRVPLVGVISMDIAIADVTDLPEVAVGDAAVLLGRASGGASISVAEYGAWAGLSEYEVTCGMSKRVPRTYVGDAAVSVPRDPDSEPTDESATSATSATSAIRTAGSGGRRWPAPGPGALPTGRRRRPGGGRWQRPDRRAGA